MRVGLIGLGNLGGRIARNLLNKDYKLSVYDLDRELLQSFKELGAIPYDSPSALAKNNEYVITVLPNAEIVKSVALGPDGLLSGFLEGSTLIDMTTSIPEVTKQIGIELSKHGIQMLDAPVSGGVKKAEDGTLAIMAGGDEAVFLGAFSLLNDIGSHVTHVGELGAGHTIKALNNMLCATTLAATAEVLAIGTKLGLNPTRMLEVINTSSGRSHSSEIKFPQQVLSRKFDVGFTIDLMCKDLTIASGIAEGAEVPSFISSAVFQLWQYAKSQGGGEMDHTAIAKFIEEMAGVEIKV
ncbi:NAD(P)-dependent oxidoreductase [Bacillus sp. ISL-47]|uniref:NAD(P)-dependent oxidoreductase n=1 Tax=Bacillus sp. ISL-47 TaxID=2819130 RepID=UPI001BE9F172|nr:NAD(P)-dependent oxidoreductase [Bacillus sp. ISL-47]MBT2689841.1 NAD(P)-dependent oxidoreductase [Bacillus sp. ISL-47]MBT2710218.1 NAD(P)-dependent oxidoreductase [Pseudomonas sp. ISL-84]